MRYLLLAGAAGALLLAGAGTGCAPEKTKTPTATTTRSAQSPTPVPEDALLVAVPPDQLVLPREHMVEGLFTLTEASAQTSDYSRAWDRDESDPGYATGATRVTISARLFPSIAEQVTGFNQNAMPPGGQRTIEGTLQLRGFGATQMKITPADVGRLGVAQQYAYRAEFTRGNADQTYVEYFIFLGVRNTRAMIQVFAQNREGAEAPHLLDEAKEIAQQQARRLLAAPATEKPTPIPTVTATPSPAATRTP